MIVLGLTGSIGMGKSTTAAMFAAEGAPVFDADAVVHGLYGSGGRAVPLLAEAFPGVVRGGVVDRDVLAAQVVGRPQSLARLEALVHPLVEEALVAFLTDSEASGAPVAILDVPLLFETPRSGNFDAVVVVSAPSGVQRERVLARPGMTEARFEALLARQVPDPEKRRRADFVVETGDGLTAARQQVRRILAIVTDPQWKRPAPLAPPVEPPH